MPETGKTLRAPRADVGKNADTLVAMTPPVVILLFLFGCV